MTGKQAIRTALQATQHVFSMYLTDLADADLLIRPVAGANHSAWQIGHLIASEQQLLGALPGAAFPALPAGFADKHGAAAATEDGPAGFRSKAEYLELFNKTREATVALVDKLSDSELDQANTGPLAQFAPTIGALLLLVSNHTLMHGGQLTVVRRKLGKPILF